MKFTQDDLLNAMGLRVGDTVSVDDKYEDLFVGVVELNESSGAVGVRSEDTFIRLSEIVRNGYDYSVIAPPKYTLTETEKNIVLAIDSRWKWLTRSAYGYLELTSEQPIKTSLGWGDVFAKRAFDMFHHLFQFIQWSDTEPVSLDELREIAKK